MGYGAYLFTLFLIFLIGAGAALFIYLSLEAEILAYLVLAGTLILMLVINIAIYKGTAVQARITVSKQERVVDRSGKSARYLIYTPTETFENTDSFWAFGKTNSSDLYGKINPGHTYNCKIAGWRVSLLSSYRNLISCQEVK